MIYKSPISYYGGKSYHANFIISNFPKNYKDLHYVEPFAGSLAVLFKKERSKVESINDLDNFLINFWSVIRDEKMSQQLYEMAKRQPHSESLAINFRNELRKMIKKKIKEKDMVKLAFYYFYCNKFLFGGSIKSGFSFQRTTEDTSCKLSKSYKRRVFNMNNFFRRMSLVQIFSRDAFSIIDLLDSDNSFFYLDPPYPESDQSPYRFYFSKDDFLRLVEKLKGIKGKFCLSFYKLPWMKFKKEWHLSFKETISRAGKNKEGEFQKRTEALVRNYEI